MQKRGATGVCSWSLRPSGADSLADQVEACGLSAVQLALDPLRTGEHPQAAVERALQRRSISVLSGMMAMHGEDYSTLESIRRTGGIVPDETWEINLKAAGELARIAQDLGISLVTFHAGFVPHGRTPQRSALLDRLRWLSDTFARRSVRIALETGQEDAETLHALLEELRDHDVGANFDPANMILYGMGEPVDAVRVLARHIRQVHIKDAVPAARAGEWGTEVPVGAGAVDWEAFLRALRENDVVCDLVIEREAGERRVEDIRAAVALLKQEGMA